jgi:hypothetical protein
MDPLLESLAIHHQLRHIEIISLDLGTNKYGPKYIPLNGIITRNCISKLGQSTWWPKLKTLISSIKNDSKNGENLNPVNVLFAEALNFLCFTGTLRCLSWTFKGRGSIMSCTDLKSLRISKCFKYSELVPFSQKIQSTVEELDLGYNFLGKQLFHLIAKFKNIKSFKQSLSLPYSSNMY